MISSLSNSNVLIITHPHVIQDVHIFLSAFKKMKVFDENIPGFVSYNGLQTVKMTVSMQLQRAINQTMNKGLSSQTIGHLNKYNKYTL